MHFSSIIPQLSALVVLFQAASAVEIRFFDRTPGGCPANGPYNYWSNIPASNCFSNNGAGSYATKFIGVPGGAKGQTYLDYPGGCSYFAQGGGSGDYCLNAGGIAYSANWFWLSRKLVRALPEDSMPTVSGFHYTTPEGTIRRLACASEDFQKVSAYYNAGDFAALAAYPDGEYSYN